MGFDWEDILFGGVFGLFLSILLGPYFAAKGWAIKAKDAIKTVNIDESMTEPEQLEDLAKQLAVIQAEVATATK